MSTENGGLSKVETKDIDCFWLCLFQISRVLRLNFGKQKQKYRLEVEESWRLVLVRYS